MYVTSSCKNPISTCALEGRVTLAKMAEVLTDATPHIALQEETLTKKILATAV